MGVVERLYYSDSYLKDFRAGVVNRSADGLRLYLDRTAFYPTSGGQPHDLGTIAGVDVADVVDEGEQIAHVLATPGPEGGEVDCRIDWRRRCDHMQQHTGQHLLSAVLLELYQAQTVGFHLSAESAVIDIACDALNEPQVREAERRANEIACENRRVTVSFENAAAAEGLRKPSEREGPLRIISIEGLDRSACGGTHVRTTGEIGPILIRKLDRAHGNLRVEFLCGMRAVARTRAEYDVLAQIARTLSAGMEELPALVAAQAESLASAEKSCRKLALELASIRGRGLYGSTQPGANGLRVHVQRMAGGALDDELRALAQGFTAGERAAFLAAVEDPPSVLLAVSKDSGLNAGNLIKAAVTARSGRGGGNPQIAQGSVPAREALAALVAELTAAIGKPA